MRHHSGDPEEHIRDETAFVRIVEFRRQEESDPQGEILGEMDKVVPWAELLALIVLSYPTAGRRGRPPMPPSIMLRIHFMQQWYALSDPAMENALESMWRFAGLELNEDAISGETMILKFRRLLERHGLAAKLLEAPVSRGEAPVWQLPEGALQAVVRKWRQHDSTADRLHRPETPQDLQGLRIRRRAYGHQYLPQIAGETARRYLFVTIDRATRWVYLRIYGDQSEASSTDFLRRLHAAAPMKIVKVLPDNGSQFTDCFTGEGRQPSGYMPRMRVAGASSTGSSSRVTRRPTSWSSASTGASAIS